MAEAAAVAVRDVTRLEPLVCFHFTLYYNNTFLVPLQNGDGSSSGQYVLFCCFFTIFLYYVYFRLISTYEGITRIRDVTCLESSGMFFFLLYIYLIILTSIHRYYTNDSEGRYQEPERHGRDMEGWG